MRPSAYCGRVVDVMEELVSFTLLARDISAHLTDRYSARGEAAKALETRLRLGEALR